MKRLTTSLKGIISFLISKQDERFIFVVTDNYNYRPVQANFQPW